MNRVVLTALTLALVATQAPAQESSASRESRPLPVRPVPMPPVPIRPPHWPTPAKPSKEAKKWIGPAFERFRLATQIVESSPTGTADAKDVRLVIRELLTLPTPILRRLKAQGTSVVVTRDSVDEHLTTLEGLHTSGEDGRQDVTSVYDSENEAVVISVVGHDTEEGAHLNGDGFELVRTLGYALDPAAHSELRVGSRSPSFLRALKREIAAGTLDGDLRTPTEAFAEAFALNATGEGETLAHLNAYFEAPGALSTRPRPPIGINPNAPNLPKPWPRWRHKPWFPRPWPKNPLPKFPKLPSIEIEDLPQVGEKVGAAIGRTIGGVVGRAAQRAEKAYRARLVLEDALGERLTSPWETIRKALPVVLAPAVTQATGLPLPVWIAASKSTPVGKAVSKGIQEIAKRGEALKKGTPAKEIAPKGEEPKKAAAPRSPSKGAAGALNVR